MSGGRTVPSVCRAFNKNGCTSDSCQNLHICFFFALGNCRYEDKCVRTHLLTTAHNSTVLKQNGWNHDNQHPKFLKMLAESLNPKESKQAKPNASDFKPPKVCFTYNTLGCKNSTCKNLHLCINSVQEKCSKGSNCPLEHGLVNSDHNLRVLREAKLVDMETKAITDKLRDMYIAMSEEASKKESGLKEKTEKKSTQKNEKKDQKKLTAEVEKPGVGDGQKTAPMPSACIDYNKTECGDADCPFLHICYQFIRGTCSQKGQCPLEHNPFQGEQNLKILRQFNLLGVSNVIPRIREGYEARAQTRAKRGKGAEAAAANPVMARESPVMAMAPPLMAMAPPLMATAPPLAPRSLTCAVCSEPFIRATTLGCAHTFCEECVQRAGRGANACPLCRAPIAGAVRSLAIDDAVDEWLDGQGPAAVLARRQLVAERRRAAPVPLPEVRPAFPAAAATAARPANKPAFNPNYKPANKPGYKPASKPGYKPANKPGYKPHNVTQTGKGRGGKTVVTTTTTTTYEP